MEKLLLDLHAILDRARILVKEYEQKIREIKEREQYNLKKYEKLEAQDKALQVREAECQKVENIQKLHRDATAHHDAANLRLNAAAEAEKALKLHVAEENSRLDQLRLNLAQVDKNNQRRAKQIDDEITVKVQAILKKNGIGA